MAVADQLSEIQRSLGIIEGTVAALKDRQETDFDEVRDFVREIGPKVNNALERIAGLEGDIKILKQVIEKTVKPLAMGMGNWRQRLIGFMAAMSLIGVAASVVFWVVTNGWAVIQRIVHSMP